MLKKYSCWLEHSVFTTNTHQLSSFTCSEKTILDGALLQKRTLTKKLPAHLTYRAAELRPLEYDREVRTRMWKKLGNFKYKFPIWQTIRTFGNWVLVLWIVRYLLDFSLFYLIPFNGILTGNLVGKYRKWVMLLFPRNWRTPVTDHTDSIAKSIL